MRRRGVGLPEGEGRDDPALDQEPVLAGLSAASVQGRAPLGPRAGTKPVRLALGPGSPAGSTRSPHARLDGFDLHAAVALPDRDRGRLERLCRSPLRPPLARDRLERRILHHLGLPATIPLPAPARAPPEPSDTLDPSLDA